jgi:hypothetical protein
MKWWRDEFNKLPSPEKGLALALDIHANIHPRHWRGCVDEIDDPIARARAEEYLRGIVERMRAVKAANNKE